MTILIYSFSNDDSEVPDSTLGVELGDEGETNAASDWNQADNEAEDRTSVFFGDLPIETERIRPGDLRIADSFMWQMEAEDFLD